MNIFYLGHSCFKIKGKKKTILTDPYDKSVGFSMLKSRADIVTISHSHPDHSDLSRVDGDPFVIKAPGEYEVGGVSVYAHRTWHDDKKGEERGKNTIYIYVMGKYRLCHLGDLGQALGEKLIEEIDGVDVLFIPIGGVYTIDIKQAIKLIEQIEPKIVLPMHYKTPEHSASFDKMSTLEDFLKEWGKEPEKMEKINLSDFDLLEETKVIVLSARK